MTSLTSETDLSPGVGSQGPKPKLDHSFNFQSVLIFLGLIACGLWFTASSIWSESGWRAGRHLSDPRRNARRLR
jgi:inorganic phosphate transporter, PiT family